MQALAQPSRRVVASERALYLLDLKLRTDTLNAALPPRCGVRISAASIDKLVIKFPTFADIQRQSGLVEVAANEIIVEMETCQHDGDEDEGTGISAENLAASISALKQAVSHDVHSAYQDAPDVDLDASSLDDQSDAAEASHEAVHEVRRSVRSNLERLIEKALGATRLSLAQLRLRLHLRSPDAVAEEPAMATVGLDVQGLAVTNNSETLDGFQGRRQRMGRGLRGASNPAGHIVFANVAVWGWQERWSLASSCPNG